MDSHELLLTALRAVGVYALMLLVIRALGKRTVGNFAAFDLLVALMLGEIVDEMIYGDVGFLQGTVAIVVIAGLQSGNAWLSWRGGGMDRLLEGTPTPIIRDGELLPDGMRKERMNVKDVMAHLRQHEVADLREVKLAAVEDDGVVSVLLHAWAQPARRGDVDRSLRPAKETESESAARFRTDAPENL